MDRDEYSYSSYLQKLVGGERILDADLALAGVLADLRGWLIGTTLSVV